MSALGTSKCPNDIYCLLPHTYALELIVHNETGWKTFNHSLRAYVILSGLSDFLSTRGEHSLSTQPGLINIRVKSTKWLKGSWIDLVK
jgi:hypothetical protein